VTRLALLIACLLLVAAAPARATGSHSPPGNSAVDEYLEDVPDSEGDRPVRPDGSLGGGGGGGGGGAAGARGGSAAGGGVLDPKTRSELARHGADGYRVAALADQSAPTADGRVGASGQDLAGGSGGGGSRLAVSADALNGDAPGGMGGWLPVVLAACAAATLAAAVLARRRRG
jgi:hypothetical protein